MDKNYAEKVITEYLKPIFGFALKRCKTEADAEDLSQEIVLRAYRALCIRDDIDNVGKFIWAIAHNTLANYYRDGARQFVGVSIDEIAEIIPDGSDDLSADMIHRETCDKLHSEIAYLSKLQRRIVIAYYYENKKQAEIARELDIPVGTVKWHLFEAKKELKKGMDIMRNNELKFNPVKFDFCSISGSVGKRGIGSLRRSSALSQNIIYAVHKKALTVNEIADLMGVSPVYIESEIETLYDNGFLLKQGDKYLCNILLDEPTTELFELQDEMYDKAADIFANELYDTLINSPLIDDESVVTYNRMVGVENGLPVFEKDKNFLMWSLIPFIATRYHGEVEDYSVTFEEAATYRPDGGFNISTATVVGHDVKLPKHWESMTKSWNGPCFNEKDNIGLCQVDTEWSGNRVDLSYTNNATRALPLLKRDFDGDKLSCDEYTFLAEHGLKKVLDNENGFWATTQCVWVHGDEAWKALADIGEKIREKHRDEFEALKKPYIEAVMEATPSHLHKMQKFGLQFLFTSDGWFILHCMKALIANGKLKMPTEEQKQALSTVVIY